MEFTIAMRNFQIIICCRSRLQLSANTSFIIEYVCESQWWLVVACLLQFFLCALFTTAFLKPKTDEKKTTAVDETQ